MSERISFEVVRRSGSRTVAMRGVWNPYGGSLGVSRSLLRKVKLPDSVPVLGEQELHELAQAIEQEMLGWQAKLPLDYL